MRLYTYTITIDNIERDVLSVPEPGAKQNLKIQLVATMPKRKKESTQCW